MAESHAEYLKRLREKEDAENALIVWTDAQKLAAFAIHQIQANQPKCSECGSGVLRPKCAYDLNHDSCPRHEMASKIRNTIEAIRKKANFPHMSEYKMPLKYQIDLSDSELKILQTLINVGGKTQTIQCMENMWSLSRKRIVDVSSQYNKWNYSISRQGQEYVNDLIAEGKLTSK